VRKPSWWNFTDTKQSLDVGGEFKAEGADHIDRLYYPIFNEQGLLSWVSARLQGGPLTSHNEYLGFPLTAEDLPHHLAHRGFWLAEKGKEPFALGISAEMLKPSNTSSSVVDAGPGWFSLARKDADARFEVRATIWSPVDLDEKVEILRVEVVNTGRKMLELTPYAAVPVYARSADNVRDHRHVSALLNRVKTLPYGIDVFPTMTFDERGHKINKIHYSVLALGPGAVRPEGIWPTQDAFLGEGGSFAAPKAVWQMEAAPKLSDAQIQGREVTAGFRFKALSLKAGGKAEFMLLSVIDEDAKAAQRCLQWARKAGVLQRSLNATKSHWNAAIKRISFGTPDPALNNWLTWVNLQPILRRVYGNSYLPQFDYGRGGKGWRDLWQDCLALLLSDPKSVRGLLLQNYGGVRIDGSNATIIGKGGTFIADRNNIPRTWMDHGVWPAYTTLLYVDQTGDIDFLLEEREYFRDPQLYRCRRRDDQWTPEYGFNLRTHGKKVYRGTVFEHMLVQNLTAFFNVGEHNLCRLEGADWNDGMDMAEHRGESVAFSAFYAWNLQRLADTALLLAKHGHSSIEVAREMDLLLDRLPGSKALNYGSSTAKVRQLDEYMRLVAGDVSGQRLKISVEDLVKDLRAKAADLSTRIRKQEWVKYSAGLAGFNGYYDDAGRRVEGRHGTKTWMTLTGQVFPVMAGIADDAQIDQVIRSVDRLLKDPRTGGVRLNTDFGAIQPTLGRAFSFAYGEKENGAVFSHMAIMYAFALYLRRRPEQGRKVWNTLYKMSTDATQSKILPCIPEYFNAEGRGMYAYLTGSASWLVYLLLTQVFGLRGEMGDLVIDPQLTREDFDADGRAQIRCPFAGLNVEVTYVNESRRAAGKLKVGKIQVQGQDLAFESLSGGGARLSRASLARKAGKGTLALVVSLVPVK
jgi:cellobiose phosphorylase